MATLQQLKDERRSIKQRFEVIERDLSASPKVPREILSTFSDSIAKLTQRIERLEATATAKAETKPPTRRDEDQEDGRQAKEDERRQGERGRPGPPNLLDRWF
ncbi:MAG TPA: hypothetical protein VGI19_16415 [Candidatus Cybelea sp.]|jgi:DNA anti-recombination protein RmuC